MKPEGWSEVRLGDLFDLSSGKRPDLVEDGPIAVYGGNGPMGSTEESLIDEPTVVIGRVGSPGTVHRTGGAAWVSDNALYVSDLSDGVELGFLEVLLEFANLSQYATDSSHPSLSQKRVFSVEVLWPPAEERRRISAILEGMEVSIAANRKVVDQARRVRRQCVRDLMRYGIGNEQYRMAEIGQIPSHWEVVPLSEVLVKPGLRNGLSPATTSERTKVPTFSIEALRRGRLTVDEDSIKYADTEPVEVEGYLLQKGDVLVTRGNANPRLVGRAGLAETFPDDSIYPDILMRVSLDTGSILPRFFVEMWNSPKVRRQIRTVAQTTSGTLKINQKQTKQILVPLPPLGEQRQILDSLPSGLDQRYVTSLRRLKRLKRGVSHDLLTGRVRASAV